MIRQFPTIRIKLEFVRVIISTFDSVFFFLVWLLMARAFNTAALYFLPIGNNAG